MAAVSDQLLVVTILAYLAAMLGYAAEYAFGMRGVATRVADRELVGAGPSGGAAPPGVAGGGPPGPSPAGPPAGPSAAGPPPVVRAGVVERIGRLAGVVTVAGAVAHTATVVTRAVAAGRVPWGNMYEFVLTVCLVGIVAWLFLAGRRPPLRAFGLFVSLAMVLLLGGAAMSLHTEAGPLVPALNSYWLRIHVSAMAAASGIFLIGFVAAALYLVRAAYDRGKRGFPANLAPRLPAAGLLERVTFRLHVFAFPIWTFGTIAGAIWAEAAWGRYWGWDPKETWAFISWVVYAAYLHARATPSVKRGTATWIAVAGWATMLINLYGVNLVISGLHSYAGVN